MKFPLVNDDRLSKMAKKGPSGPKVWYVSGNASVEHLVPSSKSREWKRVGSKEREAWFPRSIAVKKNKAKRALLSWMRNGEHQTQSLYIKISNDWNSMIGRLTKLVKTLQNFRFQTYFTYITFPSRNYPARSYSCENLKTLLIWRIICWCRDKMSNNFLQTSVHIGLKKVKKGAEQFKISFC